jgi:hypothetical protein
MGVPSGIGIPGSRVPEDSWLARWFGRRRAAEEFSCGVRVVDGELPGERTRWSYRPSAVESVPDATAVVLAHGRSRLRLDAFADEPGVVARPGLRVWSAVELESGARVQIAARADAFGG